MASNTISKPLVQKKQKNPIVGITPSTPTFGGVPGTATGPTDFTSVVDTGPTQGKPIQPVNVSQSGIVQPAGGSSSMQDVSQLTNEQQAQLGMKQPDTANANLTFNQLQALFGVGANGANIPASTPENAFNSTITQQNQEKTQTTGQETPQQFHARTDNLNFTDLSPQDKQTRLNLFKQENPNASKFGFQDVLGGIGIAGTGGAGILEGITSNIAAKTALNTPAEVANLVDKVVPSATAASLRGGVGELAVNSKTSGLISQLAVNSWGVLKSSLLTLAVIKTVFSNGYDDYRYQTALNNINTAIEENSKAISNENIPIIQQAYQQENEILLQAQKEIANPKGIDNLEMALPVVSSLATKRLRAASQEAIRQYNLNKVKIAKQRSNLIQTNTNIISNLQPEQRQAVLDYAVAHRQDVTAATTLTEAQ